MSRGKKWSVEERGLRMSGGQREGGRAGRHNFREQRIDGAGLPLLTEDHLTGMLQMKLGPALKMKSVLARRLEPCAHCQPAPTLTSPQNNNITPKINGNVMMKAEPRSNTTSPS
ncbi:hypothetical protein O0L34_g6196 [Tuta absoluta]|nr:hypothetical protein O0L34_g6196 [Tuta absoluta]